MLKLMKKIFVEDNGIIIYQHNGYVEGVVDILREEFYKAFPDKMSLVELTNFTNEEYITPNGFGGKMKLEFNQQTKDIIKDLIENYEQLI